MHHCSQSTTKPIVLAIVMLAGCRGSEQQQSLSSKSLSEPVPVAEQVADNNDTSLIQGAWQIVSARSSGTPTNEFVGSQMTFSGDALVCWFVNTPPTYPQDKTHLETRFALDDTTDPKALDWIITENGEAITLRNRVYSLNGDHLTICVDQSGTKRPAGLDTQPGDSRVVYELHRVIADPSDEMTDG